MNYALEVLKNEKKMIDNALIGFNKEDYQEAFKRQAKKSKELEEAIKHIEEFNLPEKL